MTTNDTAPVRVRHRIGKPLLLAYLVCSMTFMGLMLGSIAGVMLGLLGFWLYAVIAGGLFGLVVGLIDGCILAALALFYDAPWDDLVHRVTMVIALVTFFGPVLLATTLSLNIVGGLCTAPFAVVAMIVAVWASRRQARWYLRQLNRNSTLIRPIAPSAN